jgi:hypothetical protein
MQLPTEQRRDRAAVNEAVRWPIRMRSWRDIIARGLRSCRVPVF